MHNVLLLGSAIDTGGAERVMASLTRTVDRRQFNVIPCHLHNHRGAIGDELVADGYEVLSVGRSDDFIRRYLSAAGLRRIVRDRRIDIIHSHTHYALADAALCSLSLGRSVKVVHTFHFGNYPHVPFRYRLLESVGARIADRLVAVGIEQARAIKATYGLGGKRLDVVTNGVNVVPGEVDREWQERLRRRGAVVIGTISTLIEQKGLPDLMRVAALLKAAGANVVFVVVGGGVLRQALEDQCKAMNLEDTVLFAGWKNSASATMMPLFDVVFQPSLWEAMSIVVLEAMAAGKPVVATDVGDNRHVVEAGATGVIVPRGDVPQMVHALSQLASSPERRNALGRAGRQRYLERYTEDRMTRCYENLYLDVLRGGQNEAEVGIHADAT